MIWVCTKPGAIQSAAGLLAVCRVRTDNLVLRSRGADLQELKVSCIEVCWYIRWQAKELIMRNVASMRVIRHVMNDASPPEKIEQAILEVAFSILSF